MKTLSRRNNSTLPYHVYGGVFVCVLTFFVLHVSTHGTSTAYMRSYILPSIGTLSSVSDSGFLQTFRAYLSRKVALEEENALLKRRVADLERWATSDRLAGIELAVTDTLTESLDTATAVGIFAGKVPKVGEVVSYINYPFGTIGIHFNSLLTNTSSGQARFVFDATGICIGILDSYADATGLVRLFSRAGEEHQMRIGEHELALVRGRGGITMEAVVPKSAIITVGDPVSLPDAGHALVGSVGEITTSDTDTTQLILIRLAVPPSEIRLVYLFE